MVEVANEGHALGTLDLGALNLGTHRVDLIRGCVDTHEHFNIEVAGTALGNQSLQLLRRQ